MATTYGEAYFHVVFQPDFERKQLEQKWQDALHGIIWWKYCAVSDRFYFRLIQGC